MISISFCRDGFAADEHWNGVRDHFSAGPPIQEVTFVETESVGGAHGSTWEAAGSGLCSELAANSAHDELAIAGIFSVSLIMAGRGTLAVEVQPCLSNT